MLLVNWKLELILKWLFSKFWRLIPHISPDLNTLSIFHFRLIVGPKNDLRAIPVDALSNLRLTDIATQTESRKCIVIALLSLGTWFLFPIILGFLKSRSVKENSTEHIRGMKLLTEDELAEKVNIENKVRGVLPLGNIFLPLKYEPEHLFIAGKTRVGKTVAMMQMVQALIRANRRLIVVDLKGEYIQKFYREGVDILLNPLDKRGVDWNILNEVNSVIDYPALTESLIPSNSSTKDPFWCKAAQDVFKGIMAFNVSRGWRDNKKLWETARSDLPTIAEQIGTVKEGFAGAAQIQKAEGNKADSVYSVMMSFIGWLEFTDAGEGTFTIKEWLEKGKGNIYITCKNELEAVLRPYISLFIDLLVKRVCDMPETRDMRMTLVIDELGNLQKLPSLKKFTTLAGGRGANVIMSTQDYAAVENIYGKHDAQSIFNSCGSNMVLCLKDPTTSAMFSNLFGEFQYWDTSETRAMGPSSYRDGISTTRSRRTEKLILPSEIMALKKLEGYVKIPEFDPAKINLQITSANSLPKINEDYIQKPGLDIERVVELSHDIVSTRDSFGIDDGLSAIKKSGDDTDNLNINYDEEFAY